MIDYTSDIRKCRQCYTEKNILEFTKNKNCVNGFSFVCKQCTKDYYNKRRRGEIVVKKYKFKEKVKLEPEPIWIPHTKTISWRSGRWKDIIHTTLIHSESLRETENLFSDSIEEITIEETDLL
jgi:hypothetical protein